MCMAYHKIIPEQICYHFDTIQSGGLLTLNSALLVCKSEGNIFPIQKFTISYFVPFI